VSGGGDRVVKALEAPGGRILVTRLQYLGDVILTLPLVDSIKKRFPHAEIDYLCKPPASELLATDARFTNVFTLLPDQSLGGSIALIQRLRSRRYDAVIDLYSNPRSAWLCYFSGAGVRIGGNRRGRRHLYTHNITVPDHVRSAVDFHLQYLAPLRIEAVPSKPSYEPSEERVEEAKALLESYGVGAGSGQKKPIVGLHPGGKWEVKRWPPGHFERLVRDIQERRGGGVVVLTGPDESAFTEGLVRGCGPEVVALPALPVQTVAAVMAQFDAMVVSDGGIMHLAVAVGTPTVGIFGSSEPEIWFPYEDYGPYEAAFIEVDCRPCHKHTCPLGHTNCLNQLTPEMVIKKLDAVLKKDGRSHTDEGTGR